MTRIKWKGLLCGIVATVCALGSLPVSALTAEEQGALTNLALGRSYECSVLAHTDYPDSDLSKLTDGRKGSNTIYDASWAGWIGNSEPVEVTVDLGKVQEFYEIAVTTLEGEGGVTYPDYVTFSVSSDQNSFTELHTGLKPEDVPENSVYDYTYSSPEAIAGRYVKVTFPAASWCFLSEITVMGEVSIEPSESNILSGVKYTTSLRDGSANFGTGDFHEEHLDEGRSRLTDGMFAKTANWRDPATVGFHTPMLDEVTDKRVDLTFQFDGEKSFQQIQFDAFQEQGNYLYLPSAILIEYLDGDGQWQELYNGILPTSSDARFHYVYVVPDGESITAEGLRFYITCSSDFAWLFIDEIEALTEADGTGANINPPPITESEVPVITQDLSAEILAEVGEDIKLEIRAGVSDGGELRYTWYKGDEKVGGNSRIYTIYEATEADTGDYRVVITNTLGLGVSTAESTVCHVDVAPAGQRAQKPVLTQNLEAQKTLDLGQAAVLSIQAEVGDGGTLSYQWYRNGEPVGTNSPSYEIAKASSADSGAYKVVVTNQRSEMENRTESNTCVVRVIDPDTTMSLIAGLPYVTSLRDGDANQGQGDFHGDHPDVNRSGLTDGVYAEQWFDSGAIGYYLKNKPADITFSFGEEKSFQEIQIGALRHSDSAIEFPTYLVVEAKTGDGPWRTIYSGSPQVKEATATKTTFAFSTAYGADITATDLRFTISGNGFWAFLDEIQVFRKATGTPTSGDLVEGTSSNNNLLYGLPYEASSVPNAAYPDSGNELTDGLKGDYNFYASAWSAYADGFKTADFVFDLGAVKQFEELRLNFLQVTGPAIRLPESVTLYVSNDKETWETVASSAIAANDVAEYICNFRCTLSEPEMARYVKVSVGKTGWLFMDEIELLAKSEDSPDDSENNLARGHSYQCTEPSADHPDTIPPSKLTDGRTGAADAAASTWVGFPKADKDNEIVIDLDAAQNFEQVDVRMLIDSGKSILLPGEVAVYYSDDNASWELFGRDALSPVEIEDPIVYTSQQAVETAVRGRYIKVVFPADTTVLLDEIIVRKEKTIIPVGSVDEEYKDKNNLALGQNYTANWAVSYGQSEKTLTDGKRGGHLYTGSEWAGYAQPDEGGNLVITVDLGAEKSFEQMQVGFLKSTSRTFSVDYPKSIFIECSSDGTNWRNFYQEETQWEEEGVKRFSTSAGKGTGRYVRFNIEAEDLVFLDDIEIFEKALEGGDYETNPDAGPSFNLVRGESYTVSRSADYRSTPGLLTDGKYAQGASRYDLNWTGFKKHKAQYDNHIIIKFDLNTAHSISDIVVNTMEDSDLKVTVPRNLTFWVSQNDRDWTKLADASAPSGETGKQELGWNGARDGFSAKDEGAQMAYARYVRVEFDVPADEDVYTFLDEIKIIGKKGKCSNASEVKTDTGLYNVALHKPYTLTPIDAVDTEPDVDGKQLTDGITGSSLVSDPAWVAFNKNQMPDGTFSSMWPLRSITIDLQGTKSVTSVQAFLLSGDFAVQPWAVFTYASMDGKTWMPLSRTSNVDMWIGGRYRWGWRANHQIGLVHKDLVDADVEAVAANYIRVDVELLHTNLMDEIEIYGYDGVIEGAVIADSGRDLDNAQDYQMSGEETADVQDMYLCYNGWYGVDESGQYVGDWTAQRYRPILTYVGTDGKVKDTMFDTVLLLGLASRYGRGYLYADGYDFTQMTDWEWYLDKTFCEGGDVDELNKAAAIAAEELGDPNYKVKLVVMYPTTEYWNRKFGPINGEYLDLQTAEGYQKAADWWYHEVLTRFTSGNYENVEFVGFYWLDEQVGFTPSIVQYNTQRVHELGYKMFWIPMLAGNGYLWARDVGFDVIARQPNHFFESAYDKMSPCYLGNDHVEDVIRLASYGNTGVEMEIDDRLFGDVSKYNQALDYFNAFAKLGMDGPGPFRAWYDGGFTLPRCSSSQQEQFRAIYDYSYQLMQGTYTQKEYIHEFNGGMVADPGSTPGGNISVGGSSGSGGHTPRPETPEEEISYTWEQVGSAIKLKGSDGTYVTGWFSVDGKWYYMSEDGTRLSGWQKIDENWYYLKTDGSMATGWLKLGNVWYYLRADGAMATGWLQDNGIWYWLYDWGGMANNRWVQIGNAWYYFRGNGHMMTGWLNQGEKWYYLTLSGSMVTNCWQWIGNDCYYFYADGSMAANANVGGYRVGADGAWDSK
ncbi:DUF4855 domain-containing protein [Fumia xinanensis]|uniref:DUF4855 domain-containing protein n=1 Tax=Fumia xinanensis TaxID=2763659 RepID=A0A926E4F4_9FIRM|nr:DUF4855 domain-containing protein [Fumia xinanensis]MBC8559944.1 DUF4855 domain-containing protein [Fumia xinanensis]